MSRVLQSSLSLMQFAMPALLAFGFLCCAVAGAVDPDVSALESGGASDDLSGATTDIDFSPTLEDSEMPPDAGSSNAPLMGMGFVPERMQIWDPRPHVHGSDWGLHVLPQGLIYRSYLGGPKESRMAAGFVRIEGDSRLWDATIGGRFGLLRYGDGDPIRPTGYQFDVEASAQARLDIPENVDVRGTDYRIGFPLTWGNPNLQWKFGYYHMSSHVGDEFYIKNPDFPIFGQTRDVLLLGHSAYLTDSLRIYGEVGWAFYSNASEPWEIQFGVDDAPRVATGIRGRPFFAINGHLREEFNFGGAFTAQAGWAWRADKSAHLFRIGLQYYNGHSWQYAFLPYHEQQIGLWAWYDF